MLRSNQTKQFVITHVIIGLGRGGAEMMLRSLIEADSFSGAKNKHYVISLTDFGFHGEPLKKSGVVVYTMGLRSSLGLLKAWVRLTLLLRKLKPDIVQTWMVHSDLIGGIAARLAGVKNIIWGVRTTDYSVESRSTRAIRWLCARLSSLVPNKVVCAAQASLDSSINAGYDASKLIVIPNGFDVAALRTQVGMGFAVRQQFGLGASEVVVGCLGRYNPAKDHDNFVRAAGLLATRYPACRFLMVGRDLQSDNLELMALIESTGFADRFILLGERSDPAACLDAMDVFVLSSGAEGFPNVLGEAMAMAVPSVTTDVGDAAILLGDAGLVVPARNSEALAIAVDRLLQLPKAERQTLGHKGLDRVQSKFSIHVAAKRFADLYEELMAKG